MQWNGTYLGKAGYSPSNDIIIHSTMSGILGTYWHITYKQQEAFTLAKPYNTVLACLFDELKPVFGLCKAGSHSCHYKGEIVVLYFTLVDDGQIPCEDVPLGSLSTFGITIKNNTSFYVEVQRLLIFRYLFAIRTQQNHIVVRTYQSISFPISIKEDNSGQPNALCNNVVDNWFPNTNLDSICKEWLGIMDHEDYHNWAANFDKFFDDIEARVWCKDALRWILPPFFERLYSLVL